MSAWAMMWSASTMSPGVNGWWQMPQWVALASTLARACR